ncbi:MAG TPA: Asp-tRNA(Asn)/Glu-tRNA(Gln) amidotransferase subunit GatB, partial [Candidatus Hydrogenedentes bacterium]|nr:Asp-tRNA(Asn)/Glu-tRNA(Gln) amidotransferase subunit GatB [Candidatus Hydrogenedentota bacterium]
TEPDIRSADEAYAYLVALKQILQYIRVSDCNMEEGSLRAEANVSLRPVGSDAFGTKTEIKNVASFSGVHKAIDFEIRRQRNILESGGTVEQATRGWDADRGITFEQRSKESAHDYRYFPEPDLVPIVVDEGWEQEVRETLPELPRARFERFMSRYGLSEYDAGVLTATRDVADYFESTLVTGTDPKKAANWIMGDLQAIMAERKLDFTQCPIEPAALAEMIALIEAGTISGKIGKEILPEMLASGRRPKTLIEERGLVQISDRDALEALVHEVVAANPEPAKDYRCGNKKAFGFFMGQLMKATEGKGNPKLLTEILREALEKE